MAYDYDHPFQEDSTARNRAGQRLYLNNATGQYTTQAPVSRSAAPTPTSNPSQNYDPGADQSRREEEARKQEEARQARVRAGIETAYNPVFAELDRLSGLVPGQQQQLSQNVGDLSVAQKGEVTAGEATRENELNALRPEEEGRAKSAIRNLEGDVRNLLLGSAFYLGSKGAADSSAGGQASEGIAKLAQQSRGGILQTLNTGLRGIDTKIQGVKDMANEQMSKIDTWKATKLQEVQQWATDRFNELGSERVNATGKKAAAIASLIENSEQELVSRLKQIDDQVYQYKTSVSQWAMQRAADMEDYKTKLAISSSYKTTDPKEYEHFSLQFDPITGQGYKLNKSTGDVENATGFLPTATEKPKGILGSIGDFFGIGNDNPDQQQ